MELERLKRALVNADRTGAVDDARQLAAAIKAHPEYQPESQEQEVSAVEDVGTQFFENFNRGVYSALNAPTALANLGLDALGVDYQFKRPLEVAAPSVDRMAMETPEAQTRAGQYAGVLGEYAGANALPAAGVLAAAPKIAAATQGAKSLGGQVVNRMASSVAAAPGTAAAGEAVSTIGAGTGGAIGREMGGPMSEFIGATVGGVAAPMAMAVTPTAMARRGYSYVKQKTSPEAVKRRAQNTLSSRIQENMTPETEAALRQTADIQTDIPEFRPSMAEATESPDLVATQRAFERSMSGDDLNTATTRYQSNDKAISAAADRLRPTSVLTPDDAFRREAGRLSQARNRLSGAMDDLATRERMVSEDLLSGGRRKEQGRIIRDELIDARASTKEEMRITAGEMGLNDETATFNFESIKDALVDSVQPKSKLDDTTAIPHGIVADIKAMDDKASIVDMMALRSRITDDIREAGRLATGDKKIPYLASLKDAVDSATDQMIRQTDDPDLADRLTSFREMYRRDFAEPFETGAAGDVLKRDISGVYRVKDEEVAKQFFDGWNQTAAEQFQKVFQNSPQAQRAISDVALDDLFNRATTDGVLDLGKIESWARQNRGVIADFPEIQKRLSSTQNAVKEIAARRKVIKERQRLVEQSALARDLKRINDPITDVTGESIIDKAISSNPSQMQRLVKTIRSKEGRNALAGRVWDSVLTSRNPTEYFSQNRKSIALALGPEKLKSAERIVGALRKSRLMERPSGQPIDANPMVEFEALFGTGFNQIGSRVFAARSGRTSNRYVIMDLTGRAMRAMTGRQAVEALREAIYDPQAAADLANMVQIGGGSPQMAKRLYTYLVANGIVSSQDD